LKKDKKKRMIMNFIEEEAELGSDDEDKDDIRKKINKDDAEEDEDGLDADLADFVDHAPDDEIIGEADEEMYAKFNRDMEE
jgi:hypothetical protein